MIRAPAAFLRIRSSSSRLGRALSSYNARINPDTTVIHKSSNLKQKTPYEELLFGHTFSDHMLEVDWKKEEGWQVPVISEYKNFSMSPACVALHYALQCFEGMKAYKDKEGRVRLFRPDKNMARMNSSMARLSMPALDEQGYLECIKQVGVRIALMVSHCI
jgi:branched-chain amino acid aminotransferase